MAILKQSRILGLVDTAEPTSEGNVATWNASRASYEPRVPGSSGGGLHATSHQNGGGDEVNVGGLSGLLADAQTPLSHSHASEIAAAVTAHEGAANPHSGYATDAEAADALLGLAANETLALSIEGARLFTRGNTRGIPERLTASPSKDDPPPGQVCE